MEHEVGYDSNGVVNNQVSDGVSAGAPVGGDGDSGSTAAKRGSIGENRNLWLVLGGLIVIAIVLVVGIVMVNVGGDGATEVATESEMNTLEEYKLNFAYSTDEDIKPVLDWYKEQVNAAATNEEKAEILKDEVYFLIDYDRNNVYGEEALAVAEQLNEISDDSSALISMMNVAQKYGYQDLYDEYYAKYVPDMQYQGEEEFEKDEQ